MSAALRIAACAALGLTAGACALTLLSIAAGTAVTGGATFSICSIGLMIGAMIGIEAKGII